MAFFLKNTLASVAFLRCNKVLVTALPLLLFSVSFFFVTSCEYAGSPFGGYKDGGSLQFPPPRFFLGRGRVFFLY